MLCLLQAIVLGGPCLARCWKMVEVGVPAYLEAMQQEDYRVNHASNQSRKNNRATKKISKEFNNYVARFTLSLPGCCAVSRFWKCIFIPLAHLICPLKENDGDTAIQEVPCCQNCLLIVVAQVRVTLIGVKVGLANDLDSTEVSLTSAHHLHVEHAFAASKGAERETSPFTCCFCLTNISIIISQKNTCKKMKNKLPMYISFPLAALIYY